MWKEGMGKVKARTKECERERERYTSAVVRSKGKGVGGLDTIFIREMDWCPVPTVFGARVRTRPGQADLHRAALRARRRTTPKQKHTQHSTHHHAGGGHPSGRMRMSARSDRHGVQGVSLGGCEGSATRRGKEAGPQRPFTVFTLVLGRGVGEWGVTVERRAGGRERA